MKTLIKNGFLYMDHTFKCSDMLITGKKITQIAADIIPDNETDIIDACGQLVVPGFIDIHTHGGVNIDVNAATAEDYQKLGHFFAKEGTTSWQASIITDTEEKTSWCLSQAQTHMNNQKNLHENCADLLGIHMEGPFLSSQYKGAMPEHLLKTGDIELIRSYQEKSGNIIRYITLSPEVDGVNEIISDLIKLGIHVAIGHSGADYSQSMTCIQKGAVCATHTFNAMRLFHQHEPAIMGAVLESDIFCEAICDGIHLHPASVRLLLKTKGFDKVIAITDSIMATGLPDGEYKLGVNDILVNNGDAKLKYGGARAGSTLTSGRAFKNLMQFTGLPAEQILPLLTENPATMLDLNDKVGFLKEGLDADFLLMDSHYEIIETYVKGRKII